jgi:hypothetical protein
MLQDGWERKSPGIEIMFATNVVASAADRSLFDFKPENGSSASRCR